MGEKLGGLSDHVRVPRGDPSVDLHDEYSGGVQSAAAEGGEDERSVAERGCGAEAAVSGDDGDHQEVDGASVQLGEDAQPVGDTVRGTVSVVGEGESRLHRPLDILVLDADPFNPQSSGSREKGRD